MKKNYYQILDVEPNASDEKIKEQYLFLVQAWHPDRFSKADQKVRAEEKIKEINAAYDVLRVPSKRSEYDQTLQAAKTTPQKHSPPKQAPPASTPRRPKPTPPIMKKTIRSKGLVGSLGVFGSDASSGDKVRVYISGRAYYLSLEELVGARVEYFLNGESKGILDFKSPQHIRAAVTRVAGPNGFEIHVLRLAPYGSRPEQLFTPKVRTVSRK